MFDIVNQFLYSRVIADGEGDKLSWDLLVRIWVFGDKYVVPTLQNAVVDLILKKRRLENAIPTSQVGQIWEKTMPSSPLRRFILDYMVYKRDLTVHKLNTDKWTYDALVDLVMAFANKKEVRKGRLPVQDICHYHIHKEGERC